MLSYIFTGIKEFFKINFLYRQPDTICTDIGTFKIHQSLLHEICKDNDPMAISIK